MERKIQKLFFDTKSRYLAAKIPREDLDRADTIFAALLKAYPDEDPENLVFEAFQYRGIFDRLAPVVRAYDALGAK